MPAPRYYVAAGTSRSGCPLLTYQLKQWQARAGALPCHFVSIGIHPVVEDGRAISPILAGGELVKVASFCCPVRKARESFQFRPVRSAIVPSSTMSVNRFYLLLHQFTEAAGVKHLVISKCHLLPQFQLVEFQPGIAQQEYLLADRFLPAARLVPLQLKSCWSPSECIPWNCGDRPRLRK